MEGFLIQRRKMELPYLRIEGTPTAEDIRGLNLSINAILEEYPVVLVDLAEVKPSQVIKSALEEWRRLQGCALVNTDHLIAVP